jgi:hypothetical protein
MEVMNATARWTPERCEVWTPTQNGEACARRYVRRRPICPLAKCEVYKQLLGGGFGRRGGTDWIRQAVAIAKQMPGTPVKLIWSREEDMTHGRYHPVTQCKLTAGVDANGNLTALHMRISGQSILAYVAPANIKDGKDPVVFQGLNPPGPEASLTYTIPNLLIDHAMRNPHVPPGFWRGVKSQPEHHLSRVLHGRSGARDRAGPIVIAAQAHHQQSESSGGAQRSRRARGLGQARAEGRVPGPGADDGLRQLRRGLCRGFGQRQRRAQDPPHRRRDRSGPCGSTRSRSRRRWKARLSTAFPRRSTAHAR